MRRASAVSSSRMATRAQSVSDFAVEDGDACAEPRGFLVEDGSACTEPRSFLVEDGGRAPRFLVEDGDPCTGCR